MTQPLTQQPDYSDHNADYPYGKPRWTKVPPNPRLVPLNGNALISLLLALTGFSIPAVIFGHVALYQLSFLAPLERGKTQAWIGLVLGYLQAIAFVIFAVWAIIHLVAFAAAFSSGLWLPGLVGAPTTDPTASDPTGLGSLLDELDKIAKDAN